MKFYEFGFVVEKRIRLSNFMVKTRVLGFGKSNRIEMEKVVSVWVCKRLF